jgi:hypothetical protein
MPPYELKQSKIKVDPTRDPYVQYRLKKLMADDSTPVKEAGYRRIIGDYVNREFDRLRTADMAGIRFRHAMNVRAQDQLHNTRMNILQKQNLDLERSNSNKEMKGALIGGLLELGGIGINLFNKHKMEAIDRQKAEVNADMMELTLNDARKNKMIDEKTYDRHMENIKRLRDSSAGGNGINWKKKFGLSNNDATGDPIVPGNISLQNRPRVKNPDGSVSTIKSMSIGTDKGEVLIPMIGPKGEKWSAEEAIRNYHRTGKHLGIFRTPQEADFYADKLHNQQSSMLFKPY